MLQRLGYLMLLFCLLGELSFAQSDAGKLKGKIRDKDTQEELIGATVIIIQNGVPKGGANADYEGNYSIAPISPGSYDVKASYAGKSSEFKGVLITAGKTLDLDIFIQTVSSTEEIVITEYEIPLIQKDNTVSGSTITDKEIQKMGSRNLISIAANSTPGVYQADDGRSINVRGARSDATQFFVDGVRVRGQLALPQRSIAQLSVITGGTPAEYGDVTGGVIAVTTAGASSTLNGGVELVTSRLFDQFQYDLVGLNLSGPIYSKYDKENEIKKTILGYFVAGEAELQRDPSPSALGIYKLKDDVLNNLETNPLRPNGLIFVNNANFVGNDDIEQITYKINARLNNFRISGRLDFQPTNNITVKAGFTGERLSQRNWGTFNQMFSPNANSLTEQNTYRTWLRFQQNFAGDSSSLVKNLFYSIQADYTNVSAFTGDPDYRDNVFQYGYVGRFDLKREEVYEYNTSPDPRISSTPYWQTIGFQDTLFSFDRTGTQNPIYSNYNDYIYNTYEQQGLSIPSSIFLAQVGGIRNGDSPNNIYSLYSAPGARPGGFNKSNAELLRLTGQATAEVKNHNIKLGFEFDQRYDRAFGVSGAGLWTYMRQLANKHLVQLDTNFANIEIVNSNGFFQDTVHFNPLYVEADQSTFDKSMRVKLGMPMNSTEFINIDAYDPSTYSLDMFSADELLNDGNSYVSYFGYDYKGNRTKNNSSVSSFFNDKQNRPLNSFAPTYIAGYIQDKFELKDIIFNVGLRVDRFDANQKVLKDPYLLYPAFTVEEAIRKYPNMFQEGIPSSIDQSWIPYVSSTDYGGEATVLGYRDGDKWYDKNGAPVSPLSLVTGTGKVQPVIKENKFTEESLKDYVPQVNFMPRISFSFPINDQALFFAHYDVLTQRPRNGLTGVLTDYLFLTNTATTTKNNPSLKPERTIDYEAGFIQAVSDNLRLTASAFYRELRNLIQIQNFNNAFPITYTSFGNLDFGTVKGFSLDMDMRRKGNVSVRGSYTLQYASGTGSSFTSSRNAINSSDGFSYIRVLLPLDFDQRHRFQGVIDYRFVSANRKMGPKVFGVYPFKDAGANLTMNLGSGTPYTRNSLANSGDVQVGINQNIQTAGTPNGSRMPFQFRADLRLDKDFTLGGKPKSDGSSRRAYTFNAYLLVLNLFDTKNIIGVYRTTGLPDDDGYLNTDIGQQTIQGQINQDAFVDLYQIKVQNPNNYSIPRRFRLGCSINF